jgi:hypothetical protein
VQETIKNIFCNVNDAEAYIDDIGAFSPNWEHHDKLLPTILTKLQENGFTVNQLKCNWAAKERNWLRYWLTPLGLKPWKKKIDAVLKMEAPKTLLRTTWFHWNGKLLLRYLAPQSSHTCSVNITDRSAQKRSNTTKIRLDERKTNCI